MNTTELRPNITMREMRRVLTEQTIRTHSVHVDTVDGNRCRVLGMGSKYLRLMTPGGTTEVVTPDRVSRVVW